MRFSLVSTLAFAGLATAQLAVVQGQLDTIMQLTKDLDTAINGWTGGDPSPIIQGSQKLIDATTNGANTVNSGPALTLQEAVKIQPIVETVQKTVEKAIGDLVAKKDQASAAKLGGEAYKQLDAQLKGATALSQAISSKVPPSLAQVATTLSKGILNAVQKGIDAFSDIKDQVYPNPIAGAAAGGAAAGAAGAAAGGAATGGSRASNSTAAPTTPSVAPAAPAGGAAAAGNTTAAAGHSGASTFQPSMILGAVVLGAAVLAL